MTTVNEDMRASLALLGKSNIPTHAIGAISSLAIVTHSLESAARDGRGSPELADETGRYVERILAAAQTMRAAPRPN